METFRVKINNREYTVTPLANMYQMLYEIYNNDSVCVVGLNENAQWEANNDYPEEMIKSLALQLNQVTSEIYERS